MKIAIVTQPLISNYGGLLQNWALQTVLRREFSEVEVLTFDQVDCVAPLYIRVGSRIKSFLTGRKSVNRATKFDEFRTKHINATEKARSLQDFKRMDRVFRPNVYIVGSDQVWRPSMSFCMDANFLAFTKCKKKIAYAASFGIDTWEFTRRQTVRYRKLVNDFTAVSVREKGGISLLAKYLSCKASHVLDPTMLLCAEDYIGLSCAIPQRADEYIFTYILDSSPDKRRLVKRLVETGNECNAAFDMEGAMPRERPSVEQWINDIRYAKCVICDSFHGVAFSIIFNKDFYVLPNQQRGNSRLTSLLDSFGLSERLIKTSDEALSLPSIDWKRVNQIRTEKIAESLAFLRQSID